MKKPLVVLICGDESPTAARLRALVAEARCGRAGDVLVVREPAVQKIEPLDLTGVFIAVAPRKQKKRAHYPKQEILPPARAAGTGPVRGVRRPGRRNK